MFKCILWHKRGHIVTAGWNSQFCKITTLHKLLLCKMNKNPSYELINPCKARHYSFTFVISCLVLFCFVSPNSITLLQQCPAPSYSQSSLLCCDHSLELKLPGCICLTFLYCLPSRVSLYFGQESVHNRWIYRSICQSTLSQHLIDTWSTLGWHSIDS